MLCPNRANGLSSNSIEVIACRGLSIEATGAGVVREYSDATERNGSVAHTMGNLVYHYNSDEDTYPSTLLNLIFHASKSKPS